MEYPNDFDTPAFPAGKRIAISRAMAIAISVAFMLIVFMCGLLLWSMKSVRVDPFLISIDKTTGMWSIVGHTHNNEFAAARTLQESVVGQFTQQWLTINEDIAQNNTIWQKCNREDCITDGKVAVNPNKCAIYCAASDALYSRFDAQVMPDYRERVMSGEVWTVDMSSLNITPLSPIKATGGAWRVTANVQSTQIGTFSILAFVQVAKDVASFPKTLGFYVDDFNAYRIK